MPPPRSFPPHPRFKTSPNTRLHATPTISFQTTQQQHQSHSTVRFPNRGHAHYFVPNYATTTPITLNGQITRRPNFVHSKIGATANGNATFRGHPTLLGVEFSCEDSILRHSIFAAHNLDRHCCKLKTFKFHPHCFIVSPPL